MFIGLSIIPSTGSKIIEQYSQSPADGNILYVGGNGLGNYTTIQGAINATSDGDTVFVYDDSSPYHEHVNINKMITLIGEDKNTTVIDGSHIGTVVKLSTDGIAFCDFTVQNGDIYYAGIYICSSGNLIYNNIIKYNRFGVYLEANGIVPLSNNIVRNNELIFNYDGIFIMDYKNGYNNLFTENFIAHNRWTGIWDQEQHNGTIVTWNIIADNGRDSNASCGGIYKIGHYGVFHHNDFYFNRENAAVTGGDNEWDNGNVGNFWDDWENNLGYPDVYLIPGSEDKDHHPIATSFNDRPIVGLWGHYYALITEPISFIADTNVDPYTVSWHWDFGDGTTSDEANPSYAYNTSGLYLIRVSIIDNQGRCDTTEAHAHIGRPPNTPTITGPIKVKTGVLTNYTIVTTDPDGDNIYYVVYYLIGSDGYISYTIGPYKSGEEAVTQICWDDKGIHTIRVKAIDGAGLESDWGTLDVTVPMTISFNSLFLKLLERFPHAFPILRFLLNQWY